MRAAPPRGLHLLLGNSVLYVGSNLLQRGVGFLLLPLYARYFTQSEFGAMDLVYQGTLILILLTSLGLPQGLVRGVHLETQTEEEREKLVGALLALLLPVLLAVAALLFLARESVARLLFRSEGHAIWIALGTGLYLALSLHQLPLELLKVRLKASRYVLWSLATFLAVMGGNVWLVAGRRMGLPGMLLANILAYGAIGALLWTRTLRVVRWNLQFSRLSPLFAFGLPMLPALLCRKVLDVSDRYMIPWYHGLDELGLYVMGAKIAAVMEALLLVPFLYAWQPFFYSLSRDEEAPRIFARVTHYMALLLSFIFLALQACRDPILRFLAGGRFAGAGPIVTILALSILCNGLQYCVSAGIHLRRKLVQEMWIMVGAAALNIALNLVLIPSLRSMGAAVATLAAYAFYLVGTFVLAQRNYPVPYPWGRLLNTGLQTGLAFAAMSQFPTLALRGAILAVWIVSCPFIDLWRHDELRLELPRFRGR